MAIASLPLDVVGNTTQLRRQIEQIQRTPLILDVRANTRSNAPLGRISGEISEIDKSLAAANARVIAFGASVGAIYALQRAVEGLFQSFVNTEKKLADINAVLNLDSGGLAAFGDRLFDVAANTAQSFDVVATAATELARQGLGVDETLKRTNDALILTRLSGLDAAASVEALTAAINSFSTQALNSTEIINKLANVDAAFAVSSADLAEALSRVGSSASDAGISFDELIALVTTAQQVTARGGSVIGNSLKTIFTRLNRQETLDLLGGLGIETTDAEGKLKNQVQLLKELAVVYDDLNQVQRGEVAEKVGGVFQINILRAALSDLGKEFSIYDRALQTSVSSTDEAIQRNTQLNQTLAALGAQTLANVQKSASKIGEGLFGPAANNILNAINYLAKAADQIDSDGIGAKVGKGIIDGIGRFLGGPGLAILGAVLTKLGLSFAKYLGEASKSILGTNQAAKNQAAIQQAVGNFLAKNSTLYQSILKGQTSATQAAQLFLKQIQAQTSELQRQVAVANAVAAAVSKAASASRTAAASTAAIPVRTGGGGGGRVRAMGHVPNFSAAAVDAYIAKKKGGYEPGDPRQTRIGGQVLNWNGAESLVQYPGAKTAAIVPPENSRAGKNYRKNFKKESGGMDPYGSAMGMGFIPNFSYIIGGRPYKTNAAVAQNIRSGNISAQDAAKAGYVPSAKRGAAASQGTKTKETKKTESKKAPISIGGPSYAYLYAGSGGKETVSNRAYLSDNTPLTYSFPAAGMIKPLNFKNEVNKHMTPAFNKVAMEIWPKASLTGGDMMQYFDKSGTNQTLGRLFEAAVQRAIRPNINKSGSGGGTRFDLPSISKSDRKAFGEIFSGGSSTYKAAEFKYSRPGGPADGNVRSFLSKLLSRQKGMQVSKKGIFSTPRQATAAAKTKALGFIPNFANAVSSAMGREIDAGAKPNQVRIGTDKNLVSSANPGGFGVWSTPFESSLKEGISIAKKSGTNPKTKGMAATGFIPNFSNEDGGLGSGISATAINAAILSSLFIGQRGADSELSRAINEEVQTRKDAVKQQKMADAEKEMLDRQEQKRKYRTVQDERTGETRYVSKKTGRYVDPTLGQKELQRIDRNLKTERADIERAIDRQTKSIKPTAMDRVRGAVKTPGIGLGAAIAAPIITSMVADMIPKTTQTGRTAASAVTGLGDVVSMAGTGAMIGAAGGPKGAVVGAIIGAGVGLWQAFSGTVKEASTDMPELAAAAEAATTDFQKFQDSTTTASTALQKYQDIVQAGGSEIEKQKALGEYQQALLNVDPKDMAELERLMSLGDNFNEAAEKIARLKIPDVARTQSTSDLAEILPKIKDAIEKQQVPASDVEKALRDQIGKGLFAGQSPKEILDKAGFALDPNLLNNAFDPRVIGKTLEKLIPGSDKSSKDLRERLRQALQDENIAGYVQEVLKEAVEDKAKQAQIVQNTQKTADAVVDLNKTMYGGAADLVAKQPELQPSQSQQTVQDLLEWVPSTTAFDPKIGGYRQFELPVNQGRDVQEAQQALQDAAIRRSYGEGPTAQQVSEVFEGVLQKQIIALEMIGGDVDQAAIIAAGRVRELFDLDNDAMGNMPAVGDLLHGWLSKALERVKLDPQNPQLQKNAKNAQDAYDAFVRNSMPKPNPSDTEKMMAKMREESAKLAEMDSQRRREALEGRIKGLGKAPADYEFINENIEKISDELEEAKDALERDSYYLRGPERERRNEIIEGLQGQLDSEIQKILQLGVTSENASQSIENMANCATAICDTTAPKSPIEDPLKRNAAANENPSVIAPAITPNATVSIPTPAITSEEINPFASSGASSIVTQITSVDQKIADSKRILTDLLNANQGSEGHLQELIAPVQSIVENASAMSEKMDFTLKPGQINQMFKTSSADAERSILGLRTSVRNDVAKVDNSLDAALKLMQGIRELNDIKDESKSIDGHAENLNKNTELGNSTRLDILSSIDELAGVLPILKEISKAKILKSGCLDVCEKDITSQPLSGLTKEDLIEGFRERVSKGLAQGLFGAPLNKSALTPEQGESAIAMWEGATTQQRTGERPRSIASQIEEQLSGSINPLDFSDVQSYLRALANRSGRGSMSRGLPETGMEIIDAMSGTRSFWQPGGKNPTLGTNFFDPQQPIPEDWEKIYSPDQLQNVKRIVNSLENLAANAEASAEYLDPSSFKSAQSYIDALSSRNGFGYISRGTDDGGMDIIDAATGARTWWGAGAQQPEMLPNFFASSKEQQIEAEKAIISASGPVTWDSINFGSGFVSKNPLQEDSKNNGDQLQNMKDTVTKAFQDAVLDRMQRQNGGGFRLNREDAFGGGWWNQLPPEMQQKVSEWDQRKEEFQQSDQMMPWQEAMNEVMNRMLTGGVPDQFFQGGAMTEAGNEMIQKLLDFVLPSNPLYPGEEPSIAPLQNTKPLPLMPGEPGYVAPPDPFADYVAPNALPGATPTPTPTPAPQFGPSPAPTPAPESGSSCITNDSVRKLCSGSVNSAMGSPVGAAGGGVNSQSVGVANIDAQQANISSASTAGSSGVGGNNALGSSGLAQSAESASSSLGSVSQTAGSTASALAGLNAEIPYTSQAFGGLSSILPNVAQGFGQLSAQVPAVNAEFGSLESSLGGFSSRVNEINFEAFNQGIRSIGDSAASLKQILGTPIKIDISGQIDAPQINTTVNVDSASVVSAIQALSTKITQDITAWTRRIESQLQRLASQVASATNAANNRKM